jgi:uncharacterized protein YecE (DUF72 family)
MKKKARAWIGCSGFSYSHWKDGVFYPRGLAQRRWLEYYAEKFDTVELNVTFYRLPDASTFDNWALRTPPGFKFAVKGSKFITHLKLLEDEEEPVRQFLERASALGDKLGPLLWQTPPSFKLDRGRLKSFVKVLAQYPGALHAFEFRNATWFCEPVYDLLRNAGMTAVAADYRDLPEPPPDFPFLYLRRHGPQGQAYRGGYSEEALAQDARMIKKALRAGRELFIYFNNDLEGHAPADAETLKNLLTSPKKKRR